MLFCKVHGMTIWKLIMPKGPLPGAAPGLEDVERFEDKKVVWLFQ